MGKRIKLTIAYDGTNYCGWQIQKNGLSVQQVLEQALKQVTGEEIHVTGASRTDAGVHALGNIAVFDTEARMPGDKYSYALNTYLPSDIACVDSMEVSTDFHPRFTSTVKTYTYDILNRRFPDPTRRLYSYLCWRKLDFEKMQQALPYLVGKHDFASFQASGSSDLKETTVRTIFRAELTKKDDMIRFTIQGDGFLYHMVRIIAGTLIDIGKGFLQPEDMGRIIEAKSRPDAGPTAPACGLTLVEIQYPEWTPDYFTRAASRAKRDRRDNE